MKKATSHTVTLSVKVPPDFEAQLSDAAAQRGVKISVVLRELLGVQAQPETSSIPRQPAESESIERKHRDRRPMCLAAPSGSDPVVVRLLASVANGLCQTADAITANASRFDADDAAHLLGVLQAINARLVYLNEYEVRKNAY